MPTINNYMDDGAYSQAKAVLGAISDFYIEESYADGDYQANPEVARWENCREQGYVISMRSPDHRKQINIAFFEHRNSDNICAILWEQTTTNSPTIDTAKFGDIYKDKWDTSFDVKWREYSKMADWINDQLTQFWLANS